MSSDLIERLRAPDYSGPAQHLRSWSGLDALHAEVAEALAAKDAEIERERSRADALAAEATRIRAAARREALEEAASIAGGMPEAGPPYVRRAQRERDLQIAAAIRAKIGEEQT